tara:strand:- start:64 stop:621 length:558 start_codon:yes stop_codon:yes gene_type:complete
MLANTKHKLVAFVAMFYTIHFASFYAIQKTEEVMVLYTNIFLLCHNVLAIIGDIYSQNLCFTLCLLILFYRLYSAVPLSVVGVLLVNACVASFQMDREKNRLISANEKLMDLCTLHIRRVKSDTSSDAVGVYADSPSDDSFKSKEGASQLGLEAENTLNQMRCIVDDPDKDDMMRLKELREMLYT